MTPPLVTTVVPTYRRPQRLRRAVGSVLTQTLSSHVVHICDNASGDETPQVAASLAAQDARVLYTEHERNLGALANFNYGLARVTTPYFALLSDDDVFLPGFLEAAVAALERHPTAMFVATQVLHVEADGTVLERHGRWENRLYTPPEGLYAMLDHGAPIWTGTVFRREVVDELGLLDAGAGMAADLDYQLRLAARFPFVVDPTPGARYFHHPDSVGGSRRLDTVWPNWCTILRHLEEDLSGQPAVRDMALARFRRRFVSKLFHLGVGAAVHGGLKDARGAADVLGRDFHERGRALVVRAALGACLAVPAAGPALGWAIRRTRLLRHPGFRRRARPA